MFAATNPPWTALAVASRVLGVVFGLSVGAAAQGADVPSVMSYQGVLTFDSGRAVADGSYVLDFSVVDGGGAVRYNEQATVGVKGGLYSVLLGGQAGGALASAFDDAPRFLDVTIVSGQEPGIVGVAMPRQTMAPVPFAMRAGRADAAVATAASVPANALILWDQATGCNGAVRDCPCGWSEAVEFQGLMIRGADRALRWDDLPDTPGAISGSVSATGKYGDSLTAAEMPSHDHTASSAGSHRHSFPDRDGYGSGPARVQDKLESDNYGSLGWNVSLDDAGNHNHATAFAGASAPHRHPSVRMLFCRKD